MAKDAEPSSHSSFPRFERVMKALIALPKKEVEEKTVEPHTKRRQKRKRTA